MLLFGDLNYGLCVGVTSFTVGVKVKILRDPLKDLLNGIWFQLCNVASEEEAQVVHQELVGQSHFTSDGNIRLQRENQLTHT